MNRRCVSTIASGLCLAWLIAGCSMGSPTKGNGSGSENTFSGRILYQDGTPAAGVTVRIYPVNYVPSLAKSNTIKTSVKTTDSDGYYNYSDLVPGLYNIDASIESLGAFIDSIVVAKDSSQCKVPDGILKKPGMITGVSHMPGQSDTNQVRVTLYMPGTGRIMKPIIGGRFVFSCIPAGGYQLIIDPTLNDYNVRIMNIVLSPGDTLDLDTLVLQKYASDTIEINNQFVSGVWGPNKVYKIYSTIEVPAGTSLEIMQNTKILMMGNLVIRVFGTLKALGKADSMVIFSYGNPNPSHSSWVGFNRGADPWPHPDTMILTYCILEYATSGITIEESLKPCVIKITHCVVRHGMLAFDLIRRTQDSTTIADNIFHDIDFGVFWLGGTADAFYTIRLVNNIVLNVGNVFGEVKASHISVFSDHNCYFGFNKWDYFPDSIQNSSPSFGPHDLQVNPGFISHIENEEDYHFEVSSPCKATGINGTDIGIYSTYEP